MSHLLKLFSFAHCIWDWHVRVWILWSNFINAVSWKRFSMDRLFRKQRCIYVKILDLHPSEGCYSRLTLRLTSSLQCAKLRWSLNGWTVLCFAVGNFRWIPLCVFWYSLDSTIGEAFLQFSLSDWSLHLRFTSKAERSFRWSSQCAKLRWSCGECISLGLSFGTFAGFNCAVFDIRWIQLPACVSFCVFVVDLWPPLHGAGFKL